MNALSLRVRVAVAVAITCIVIMIGLGLTLHTASEKLEHSLVNQIVNEEMVFLVRHHLENPNITVSAPGPNLEYFVVRDKSDMARVPAGLRDLPIGHHEVMVNNEEQHVAVREVDGTRFIVAYDAGPHEIREQKFREFLYFALAAVTVISATLGYWVAGLITRQISRLSSRVASMDPGAPRAPLLERGQSPEVATLASAFDQYQARIRSLIEREQEFTGNASHELRTPLTAIRTSCELLESETGLSEKTRARITAISAAAKRMTGQIEMLLYLARAQTTGTRESVSIASCINDAVQPLLSEIADKPVDFENRVPGDAVFMLNRHALDIVITNLLRNAFIYTERGHIRISLDHKTLLVSDTGIGIEPAQLPRIFGRFHRAGTHGDGFGLGLAIVQRICDLHGWIIDVDSTPSQGSTFRLTLT
jgi:signal transduction histidine kinase